MILTTLVLLRHGESRWNDENRFTGWYDIDLSEKGVNEAKLAGKILRKSGFIFDYAYTSMLKRAIHTLWHVLDELDQAWLPVEKSWKLNERHYGSLQGLKKTEMAKKYGEEQVKQWRRSFSIVPPKITENNKRYSGYDYRYIKLSETEKPLSESLEMTANRVIPYWNTIIFPKIKIGTRLIIVAHGNSIRALVKYLDRIDDKNILELNIPTGIPLVYEFDNEFKPIRNFYLKDINES